MPQHPPSTPLLYVVVTIIDVACALPVPLVDGHVLRRPTTSEIDKLKKTLQSFASRSVDLSLPFEFDSDLKPLPQENWKYLVIEVTPSKDFDSPYAGVPAIEQASSLTDLEIECPVCIYPNGGVHLTWYGDTDPFRTTLAFGRKPPTLDTQWIHEISTILTTIRTATQAFQWFAHSLGLFRHSLGLTRGHHLQTLGFFAVIESLLTHNPAGRADSLTRQISTKIPLLNRRATPAIDYAAFGITDTEGFWKRLYGFRSAIAHGGDYTTALADVEHFPDPASACEFLRHVSKRLLRHAMTEPYLLQDLRHC